MYRFIYPTKDSYIYELNLNRERNFGGDDSLILKKDFDGLTGLNGVSRILLNFDLTEISNSIVSGDITSASYYLRLYEKNSSELSPTYQLNAYALSQSWEGGTGTTIQDPNNRDGVSWKKADETFDNTQWTVGGLSSTEIPMTSASKPLDSLHLHLDTGSRSPGGGVWYDEGGLANSDWTSPSIAGVSSQSFSYESPNINMDVTDIVNKWIDGTRENKGFILKWSGSQESSTDKSGNVVFHSIDANSVYSPKLEVRWDDKVSGNPYSLELPGAYAAGSSVGGGLGGGHVGIPHKLPFMNAATDSCTISFWFKWTGKTGVQQFLFHRSMNQISWYVSYSSHKMYFAITDASSNVGSKTGNTAITPLLTAGAWHHLVAVVDRDEQDLHIYVDASKDTTDDDSGSGSISNVGALSTPSLYDATGEYKADREYYEIGRHADGAPEWGGSFISGSITDYSIFNVAKSATEISSMYNSGVPTDLSNETGLVAYWRFNEGAGSTGTTLTDSSGNGFDAFISGSGASWSTDTPASGSFGDDFTATDGTTGIYVYMKNLRDTYRETETPKFRVGIRERYITKSVSTTKSTLSKYYLKTDKGWYSIIDVATGETLIPFGDDSKLSLDITSHYFKLNLKSFITNRLYRIIYRIEMDDGRYRIFDDNFNFKVVS